MQTGLEPCVESLLDIEYAGSVAAGIPMTIYYSGTYSLLDWYVCARWMGMVL